MKRALLLLCAASLAGTLRAADGDLLAETQSPSPAFAVWASDGATWAVASAADIAALPPVAWRAGETATATSCDGTATTLVSAAATDGSAAAASILISGGVWTFENVAQGTARVGVPWTVFDDGGTLASGAASPEFKADAKQTGPDRRISRPEAPEVAYTGDHWVGDALAFATLTVTPPAGAATVFNRTGTGTEAFDFTPSGIWTATLAMADGTTLSATLDIRDLGTTIFVR